MIKNKIKWIHKGVFSTLFVVLVLLISVNLKANFNYQKPVLISKVEVGFKQGTSKITLFSVKDDGLIENQSDFEENEIEADDFVASLLLFSSKTVHFFNHKEELVGHNTHVIRFFKIPYYILFCNLKIHSIA